MKQTLLFICLLIIVSFSCKKEDNTSINNQNNSGSTHENMLKTETSYWSGTAPETYKAFYDEKDRIIKSENWNGSSLSASCDYIYSEGLIVKTVRCNSDSSFNFVDSIYLNNKGLAVRDIHRLSDYPGAFITGEFEYNTDGNMTKWLLKSESGDSSILETYTYQDGDCIVFTRHEFPISFVTYNQTFDLNHIDSRGNQASGQPYLGKSSVHVVLNDGKHDHFYKYNSKGLVIQDSLPDGAYTRYTYY